MNKVAFHRVIPNDDQIQILYSLLNQREHQISHKTKPLFTQHKDFVCNNPYRSWYIVEICNKYIGSFYISMENTIGINLEINQNVHVVDQIIKFAVSNYKPLAPIASVRSDKFAINVAPHNDFLNNTLMQLNCTLAQITYYLPNE